MRDPLAPVIEGFDLSGLVNRYSFECEPFFTDKGESATMLDGSTVHDVFPLKARFSWALNSLSASQYAALNAALRDTVTAQIFDPTINAVRSARFHVTRPAFVYNFATQDYMAAAGSTLILEDAAPRASSAVTPAPRQVDASRDPLAPVIARYDLSGIVNRYSLQCEPFSTDGGNGGTMQDGSTIQDVLADKFRLSWTLNAISAQQYADLCAVLSSGTAPDTVSASVFNPVLRAGYTMPFHVTFPAFRFALDNGQCMAYADSALVLEESSPKRGLPVMGGDDWHLFDDGTLELDPLPPEGDEADRWRRVLDILDAPSGDPNAPIRDVDRIKLNPGIPSLPSGVPEQFPNLDTIVIPPDCQTPPDAFDNCPGLTVIKIVSLPSKSDYFVGESLDYAGLRVIEIFDGAERDITPECVLLPAEGYVTNVVEDIMVDVRYHDKSLCTFWVQVAEAEVIASGDWWTMFSNGRLDIYCVGDMPEGVGDDAYLAYDDQITTVIFSNSVTGISDWAFNACQHLTSVIIPDSITSIGIGAFDACGLTGVNIPNSVTNIGARAFSNCRSLINIVIPDSVTNIGASAFSNCDALTSVTIPDSVTSIGTEAFAQSGLVNATIPGSVAEVDLSMFYDCHNLTSIVIEDGATAIYAPDNSNCSSQSITIPASVTTISALPLPVYWGTTVDVYYGGTEEQWDEVCNPIIVKSDYIIHYNSSPT
ncbi:MAG: leucine-rich repeat domain-containing protein [Oscillibacter sp.]|nr:leucine-rich repeat domain-containing protein [Oscillibacter sp.]